MALPTQMWLIMKRGYFLYHRTEFPRRGLEPISRIYRIVRWSD